MTVDAAFAQQSDWTDNPMANDVPCYSVQCAFPLSGGTQTEDHDVLGSNIGRRVFPTPVATLHRYQGWTDKFRIAPPDAVSDAWFRIAGNVGGARLSS